MENMRRLGAEDRSLRGLSKILKDCPDEDDDVLFMDPYMHAEFDIETQREKVKKARGRAKTQAQGDLDKMLQDEAERDWRDI